MTPAEVVHRVMIRARHWSDELTFQVARPLWRRWWYPTIDAPAARRATGFLVRERAEWLRDAEPASCACLIDRAERVLQGRFAFFGYEETTLPRPLDFTLDPLSGFRWPALHAKRIDYRTAPADPKWIWELNRCQHLTVLVAAWLLTEREEFARCAVADALEWIRQTLPGRGIAWANGYEAALRALSFAVAADGLLDSRLLDDEARRTISLSLWQHHRWIVRDPSPGSSANNHRLGELVGLLAVGILAPELPGTRRRLPLALCELESQAERQILPDGGNPEQAFTYAVYVADLLLLSAALLSSAGRDRSRVLDAALERAASAFAAQMSRNEPAPRYGDNGEDRAIVLDGNERRDARGVCSGIAAHLGSADARLVAAEADAAASWLFGEAGAERFASAPAAEPQASCELVDTGLVVFRRASSRALFDMGRLGYLSLAAHGHADALHVSLSDAGGELVSDPGVGSYFRPDWRRAFRGTGFHATVEVDGLDQSESGGPFLWTRHGLTTVHQVDLDGGFALAEHDGYAALEDPVRHVRAVALLPDGALLVYDRLEAAGAHVIRQCWTLHPSLEAVPLDEGRAVRVTSGGEPRLLMVFAGNPGRLSVATGQTEPLRGWWSPRLESAIPSPLCALEVREVGVVEIAALLTPASGSWPTARLQVEDEGSAVRLQATTDACVCEATIALRETGRQLRFLDFRAVPREP